MRGLGTHSTASSEESPTKDKLPHPQVSQSGIRDAGCRPSAYCSQKIAVRSAPAQACTRAARLNLPCTPWQQPTAGGQAAGPRSEEHTSELQSLMRISYAVFCLKKKNNTHNK